jgi:hypothetical protein
LTPISFLDILFSAIIWGQQWLSNSLNAAHAILTLKEELTTGTARDGGDRKLEEIKTTVVFIMKDGQIFRYDR